MSQLITPIFKGVSRVPTSYPASTHELKLVTSFPGNNFPDGLTASGLRSVGVISRYPAKPVDYDAAIYITWFTSGLVGLASYGEFNSILSSSTTRSAVRSIGLCRAIFVTFGGVSRNALRSRGNLYTTPEKGNLIKWSNIGVADFTIGKDNVAGERVLDWKGYVYAIKKLGNKAVVYGENGVSMLIPAGNTYGMQTVYRIGLKGKDAVAGNEMVHFFIDKSGQLFSVGENKMKATLFEATSSPELLGYDEYLSELVDPVLSWDDLNSLLYICDGTLGFVYSPKSASLGKGPVNITGISWQGGQQYVAAPAPVVVPPFEICTDIYDFDTHKYKTIHAVEIGTNVTGTLQVAIDYRSDYSADFSTTPWKDVTARGTVFITALGREIRIRVRLATYEYLEIDYITVKGIIHDQ